MQTDKQPAARTGSRAANSSNKRRTKYRRYSRFLGVISAIITATVPMAPTLSETVVEAGAWGAKGDGTTDDTASLQAAVDAADGDELHLSLGARYMIRNEIILKARVLDCQGAELFPDAKLSKLNAIVRVGRTHVVIRNCWFTSSLGHQHYAVMLDSGATDVTIQHNRFTGQTHHGLVGIGIRARGISKVHVIDNRAEDIRYLVYVDGDETQTWHSCADLPTGNRCDNTPHPPPAGITKVNIPPTVLADIVQRHFPFGIIVRHQTASNLNYRLWERDDFVRSNGELVFVKPLESDPRAEVQLFTWDPAKAPANDLDGLAVERNVGNGFRAAAVQINCPVRAVHKRVPFQDCPRRVTVNDNRFDMRLQPDTFSSFPIEGAEGIVAQVISINGVDGFEVKNNTISTAVDQGIHTEDFAAHGTISHNKIDNARGWGIYLANSKDISVIGNQVTNSELGCIGIDATEKTRRFYTDPYMTNQNISLVNNLCDLSNNQRAWAGFMISGAREPLALTATGNLVKNLSGPRAKGAYIFQGTARCDKNIGTASAISPGVPVYANCAGK